jgi:hypothetical protein
MKDAKENLTLKSRLTELSQANELEKKQLETQLSHVVHSQAGQLSVQREKISTLQKSLHDELSISQNRIAEQEKEIKWLKKALDDTAIVAQEPAEKLERMQTLVDAWQSQAKAAQIELVTVVSQADVLKSHNSKLTMELNTVLAEKRHLQEEISGNDHKMKDLTLTIEKSLRAKEELIQYRTNVLKECDSLKHQLHNSLEGSKKDQTILSNLKDKISSLEIDLSTQLKELQLSNSKSDDISNRNNILENEKDELTKKLNNTLNDLELRFSSAIEGEMAKFQILDSKRKSEEDRSKEFENELSNLQERSSNIIEKQDIKIENLEKSLLSIQNDLSIAMENNHVLKSTSTQQDIERINYFETQLKEVVIDHENEINKIKQESIENEETSRKKLINEIDLNLKNVEERYLVSIKEVESKSEKRLEKSLLFQKSQDDEKIKKIKESINKEILIEVEKSKELLVIQHNNEITNIINEYKQLLVDQKESLDKLNLDELNSIRSKSLKIVEEMETTHSDNITNSVKYSLNLQKEELMVLFNQEKNALLKNTEEKISNVLSTEHELKLNEQLIKYENNISSLNNKHLQELESLNDNHLEELDCVKNEFQEKISKQEERFNIEYKSSLSAIEQKYKENSLSLSERIRNSIEEENAVNIQNNTNELISKHNEEMVKLKNENLKDIEVSNAHVHAEKLSEFEAQKLIMKESSTKELQLSEKRSRAAIAFAEARYKEQENRLIQSHNEILTQKDNNIIELKDSISNLENKFKLDLTTALNEQREELVARSRADADRLRSEILNIEINYQKSVDESLNNQLNELSCQRQQLEVVHNKLIASLNQELLDAQVSYGETISSLTLRQSENMKVINDYEIENEELITNHKKEIKQLFDNSAVEIETIHQFHKEEKILFITNVEKSKSEITKLEERYLKQKEEFSQLQEEHNTVLLQHKKEMIDLQDIKSIEMDETINDLIASQSLKHKEAITLMETQHRVSIAVSECKYNEKENLLLQANKQKIANCKSSHEKKQEELELSIAELQNSLINQLKEFQGKENFLLKFQSEEMDSIKQKYLTLQGEFDSLEKSNELKNEEIKNANRKKEHELIKSHREEVLSLQEINSKLENEHENDISDINNSFHKREHDLSKAHREEIDSFKQNLLLSSTIEHQEAIKLELENVDKRHRAAVAFSEARFNDQESRLIESHKSKIILLQETLDKQIEYHDVTLDEMNNLNKKKEYELIKSHREEVLSLQEINSKLENEHENDISDINNSFHKREHDLSKAHREEIDKLQLFIEEIEGKEAVHETKNSSLLMKLQKESTKYKTLETEKDILENELQNQIEELVKKTKTDMSGREKQMEEIHNIILKQAMDAHLLELEELELRYISENDNKLDSMNNKHSMEIKELKKALRENESNKLKELQNLEDNLNSENINNIKELSDRHKKEISDKKIELKEAIEKLINDKDSCIEESKKYHNKDIENTILKIRTEEQFQLDIILENERNNLSEFYNEKLENSYKEKKNIELEYCARITQFENQIIEINNSNSQIIKELEQNEEKRFQELGDSHRIILDNTRKDSKLSLDKLIENFNLERNHLESLLETEGVGKDELNNIKLKLETDLSKERNSNNEKILKLEKIIENTNNNHIKTIQDMKKLHSINLDEMEKKYSIDIANAISEVQDGADNQFLILKKTHTKEIEELQFLLDNERIEIEENLKNENALTLVELNDKNITNIQEINSNHSIEIIQLKSNHSDELIEFKDTYNKKFDEIQLKSNGDNELSLRKLKLDLEQELSRIKNSHSIEIQELNMIITADQIKHQKEIEEIHINNSKIIEESTIRNEKQISILKLKSEQLVQNLNSKSDRDISVYSTTLKELEDEHLQDLEAAQSRYTMERESSLLLLRDELELEMNKLKKSHFTELNEIKVNSKNDDKLHEEEIEKLKTQLNESLLENENIIIKSNQSEEQKGTYSSLLQTSIGENMKLEMKVNEFDDILASRKNEYENIRSKLLQVEQLLVDANEKLVQSNHTIDVVKKEKDEILEGRHKALVDAEVMYEDRLSKILSDKHSSLLQEQMTSLMNMVQSQTSSSALPKGVNGKI